MSTEFNFNGEIPTTEQTLETGYTALGFKGNTNYLYSHYKNRVIEVSPTNLYNEAFLSDTLSPHYIRSQAILKGSDVVTKDVLKSIGNNISLDCARLGEYDLSKVKKTGVYVDDNDPDVLVLNFDKLTRTDGKAQKRVTDESIYIHDQGTKLDLNAKPATAEDVKTLQDGLSIYSFKKKSDLSLLIGFMGNCIVNGALDWRAHLNFIADGGSGKSELQKIIADFLKPSAYYTTGASVAGVKGKTNGAPMVVIIDEFDATLENLKNQGLLEMMTKASSGGKVLMGNKDQNFVEFKYVMAFITGGVAPLNTSVATSTRIIEIGLNIFDVEKLDNMDLPLFVDVKGSPAHAKKAAASLGAKFYARMFARWSELSATIRLVRKNITKRYKNSRFADTYGTAIASSWVMQHDQALDANTVDAWVDSFELEDIVETTVAERDSDVALRHLLSTAVNIDGKRYIVGDLAVAAATQHREQDGNYLKSMGIKAELNLVDMKIYLSIHTTNPEFKKLFNGSIYQSAKLSKVFENIEGVRIEKSMRIGNHNTKAIVVPTNLCFDLISVKKTVQEGVKAAA